MSGIGDVGMIDSETLQEFRELFSQPAMKDLDAVRAVFYQGLWHYLQDGEEFENIDNDELIEDELVYPEELLNLLSNLAELSDQFDMPEIKSSIVMKGIENYE